VRRLTLLTIDWSRSPRSGVWNQGGKAFVNGQKQGRDLLNFGDTGGF